MGETWLAREKRGQGLTVLLDTDKTKVIAEIEKLKPYTLLRYKNIYKDRLSGMTIFDIQKKYGYGEININKIIRLMNRYYSDNDDEKDLKEETAMELRKLEMREGCLRTMLMQYEKKDENGNTIYDDTYKCLEILKEMRAIQETSIRLKKLVKDGGNNTVVMNKIIIEHNMGDKEGDQKVIEVKSK